MFKNQLTAIASLILKANGFDPEIYRDVHNCSRKSPLWNDWTVIASINIHDAEYLLCVAYNSKTTTDNAAWFVRGEIKFPKQIK